VRLRRPSRLKSFDYKGKHCYFITCATFKRRKLLVDSSIVLLLREQILSTCRERHFEVLAYAFMEDHVHLLMKGTTERSQLTSTMTLVRQRTAVAYARARKDRLWQDGYFERVLRPTDDVFEVIRYIRENPGAANLGEERTKYPYVSSTDARSAPL
jgi:putative transposase